MAMAGATTPNRRAAQKPPQKDVWLFGSKQQREEAIDDIVRQVPDVRGRLKRMRAAELVSEEELRALRDCVDVFVEQRTRDSPVESELYAAAANMQKLIALSAQALPEEQAEAPLSPAAEEPSSPHWAGERNSLQRLNKTGHSDMDSLNDTVNDMRKKLEMAKVTQAQTRRTFAETRAQEKALVETRRAAETELEAAMEDLATFDDDRVWPVPRNEDEVERLHRAVEAAVVAPLEGVDAEVLRRGQAVKRTKDAEVKLVVLYERCALGLEDRLSWERCKHELRICPACAAEDRKAKMAAMYRLFDEAQAEGADAALLRDAEAMKQQLASADADAARKAAEEERRVQEEARRADAEEDAAFNSKLRTIVHSSRVLPDTSEALSE